MFLKIVLLGLLAALPHSAGALTLSDIRTNARTLVQDSGTATSRLRFSDAKIDEFSNECQREAVGTVYPLMESYQFELVAQTTYYSLPNNFLAVKRLTWKGRVLPEKSPVNLDQTKEWESISGTPINYFVTFSSRTKVGIYPFPADSSSTGTIKVDYYSQADEMDDSADVPFNGVREFYPFHHMITYCAASRMAAIDGQGSLAAMFMQIYVQSLARLSSVAMSRPAYSPAVTPNNQGGQ